MILNNIRRGSKAVALASALIVSAGAVNAHEPTTQMAEGMSMTAASSKAADLRVTLTQLLGEHVVLAASATGAALGGRNAEFEAAAAALDTNSVDIADAVGSVYGPEAGEAFLPLWRKHIGFFVDYTTGLATDNSAQQDKAISDLVGYSEDFGAFINSASPTLSKDAVAALVKEHAITLKSVIDAQAAGDTEMVYKSLRKAYSHMSHIAGALAEAIVGQFPEKFV